jgi:hypothetical protein
MTYPYWNFFFGKKPEKFILKPDTCPVYFAYGAKKDFMFHSQKWITKLEDHPKCRVEKMNSGHWITASRESDRLNKTLLEWLE